MNRLCNNCTHGVFAFGMVHYIKGGINVMGPSTTRSLSPCHVDGRPIERSADCSIAFPARATPMRPRQPSSRNIPSPRSIDGWRTVCPADNNLDITAVERIQLAARSCDRRPHLLSFYSTQQNDAKGIVDFVRHKARFCDYFCFVF